VWTAQPGAGGATVVRYRADGSVDRTIAAPRNSVVGLCTYGAGLRQLLLLGANGGLRLVDDLQVRGLEEALFDDRGITISSDLAFPPE
jgi:sugar lactone lactonase YvrE